MVRKWNGSFLEFSDLLYGLSYSRTTHRPVWIKGTRRRRRGRFVVWKWNRSGRGRDEEGVQRCGPSRCQYSRCPVHCVICRVDGWVQISIHVEGLTEWMCEDGSCCVQCTRFMVDWCINALVLMRVAEYLFVFVYQCSVALFFSILSLPLILSLFLFFLSTFSFFQHFSIPFSIELHSPSPSSSHTSFSVSTLFCPFGCFSHTSLSLLSIRPSALLPIIRTLLFFLFFYSSYSSSLHSLLFFNISWIKWLFIRFIGSSHNHLRNNSNTPQTMK